MKCSSSGTGLSTKKMSTFIFRELQHNFQIIDQNKTDLTSHLETEIAGKRENGLLPFFTFVPSIYGKKEEICKTAEASKKIIIYCILPSVYVNMTGVRRRL